MKLVNSLGYDEVGQLQDLAKKADSAVEEFKKETMDVAWSKWELEFAAILQDVGRILGEVLTVK